MAKKLKEGFNVGLLEKTSYGIYFLGQNLFYGLVGLNIHTFFADIGITIAAVAAIVFITKVWDAVNDPLFGVIIDKIRFKKGRFLPWLRISLPIITLSSIFLFAMPSSGSPVLKIVWAIIGYVAWDMSYTVCDVPIFVLPTSMTDNIKERTSILALGRYLGIVGVIVCMFLLPMLQKALGWFGTGLIISLAGAAFMLPICFTAKERHIVRTEKETTIKEMVTYVIKNKYLIIFYAAFFISGSTAFGTSLGMFFARFNLGDQNLAGITSLAGMIPMLIVGAFVPFMVSKIDKFKLYFIASICTVLLGFVRYFVGYDNLVVYMIMSAIGGVFSGITAILMFMFTPDCLEYGTYHTGERAEGVAVSIQTFFAKLTGGIAAPISLLILGAFGFLSGEQHLVQSASAMQGIWLCMTIFPAIGAAVALAVLSRYKLRDKDVQVMAEYNIGKITKEEAEEKLAEKYGPAADLGNLIITSAEK